MSYNYTTVEPTRSEDLPNLRDVDDRQIIVAVTMALIGLVIPALIVLGLLVPTAWMAATGHHPQAPLWGWLSDVRHSKTGEPIYDPANWIVIYYLTLGSAWLTYYFCEGLWLAFRPFYRALSS